MFIQLEKNVTISVALRRFYEGLSQDGLLIGLLVDNVSAQWPRQQQHATYRVAIRHR